MDDPTTRGRPTPPITDLDDLRHFLDTSPSPWHAAASAARRLTAAGFVELDLAATWSGAPSDGFVRRGGALIAWRHLGTDGPRGGLAPVRIVGAHTDSPGLRVKPLPDTGAAGWKQLGVEVYGGALLNSWLDRDLGVAGRVVLADGSEHLVCIDTPVARVPQLAIHLDREVNDKGLVLDRQTHLTPVWGLGSPVSGEFADLVAAEIGTTSEQVAAWDLCLYDVQRSALVGPRRDLLASGRLDNQVSCWAAAGALVTAGAASGRSGLAVVALFDHEEVGSESVAGAAGPLLEQVLERLSLSVGADRAAHLTRLAGGTCISADNAHSVHPNYVERHEPGHRPIVNAGPVLKLNSNQRYASSAESATMARQVFEAAGVPWQVFVSRNNMPCGTTIGPLTATRLGMTTVDIGVPQLSMHSARELCGVDDPVWLATALRTYLEGSFAAG